MIMELEKKESKNWKAWYKGHLPFTDYGCVPASEMYAELKSRNLLSARNRSSHIALYNELCCCADKDLVVILGETPVLSGWTDELKLIDLESRIGLDSTNICRALKRIKAVYNREETRGGHGGNSFRYQLKVFERNHNRLEQEKGNSNGNDGDFPSIVPFKSYYPLPNRLRTAELKRTGLLRASHVALYDALLSYVDFSTREISGMVSGWTYPVSYKFLSARAGLGRNSVCKILGKLEKGGLMERERVSSLHRYRVSVYKPSKRDTNERE